MNISIDNNNIVTIGDYKIDNEDEIFTTEGWHVADKEEHLEHLKQTIKYLDGWEFDMCLSDINFLNSITDTFIFKSNGTNEMIAELQDKEYFKETYESFLEVLGDRNGL